MYEVVGNDIIPLKQVPEPRPADYEEEDLSNAPKLLPVIDQIDEKSQHQRLSDAGAKLRIASDLMGVLVLGHPSPTPLLRLLENCQTAANFELRKVVTGYIAQLFDSTAVCKQRILGFRLKILRPLGIEQCLNRPNMGFGLVDCLQLVIRSIIEGLGELTPVLSKQREDRRVWVGIAVKQPVYGNNSLTSGARRLLYIVDRCMREKPDSCPCLDEMHQMVGDIQQVQPWSLNMGLGYPFVCVCLSLLADSAERPSGDQEVKARQKSTSYYSAR
jgi:hypothetical protein